MPKELEFFLAINVTIVINLNS